MNWYLEKPKSTFTRLRATFLTQSCACSSCTRRLADCRSLPIGNLSRRLIRDHVLPKIQSRRLSDGVVLASCTSVCDKTPFPRLVTPISIMACAPSAGYELPYDSFVRRRTRRRSLEMSHLSLSSSTGERMKYEHIAARAPRLKRRRCGKN